MPHKIRGLENLHIPLWLLKDTCWLMQWRPLGIIMIVPTVTVAFALAWKTRHSRDVFMNLAVCAWITANAFWMCCEFFKYEQYKSWALLPFSTGIAMTVVFFIKKPDAVSIT